MALIPDKPVYEEELPEEWISDDISGWKCDDRNAIINGLNSTSFAVNCYYFSSDSSKQFEEKITVSEDLNILSSMKIDIPPINGFVEFSRGSIVYHPFENWGGHDNFKLKAKMEYTDTDSDIEKEVGIKITILSVENYQCNGNRVPIVVYGNKIKNTSGETIPGPETPFGSECVKPIKITSKDECNNVNKVWNPDSAECQEQGIPDPFFRKNYQPHRQETIPNN